MYFIDTNVFVYAFDNSNPKKSQKARHLIEDLSNSKKGYISTQVVQEFCNVALRKSAIPLKPAAVRMIIRTLLAPLLAHRPDELFYARVIDTFERYSLSFYDAAIIQAAIDLRCTVLYSEGLQDGVSIGGVRVVNPFTQPTL